MDKLFKWAILNSATANEDPTVTRRPPRKLEDLDPGIIDLILGKDDATVMREIMDALEDPNVEIEKKEELFEELEVLVGHIDNAQNLVPLKMWPRILAFLESPEPEMRLGGIWIAGTSVQNNPKSKVAFIEENGMLKVLKCLQHDEDAQVRSKALYCISSLLQNAPPIIEFFAKQGGYDILLGVLRREKEALQRKTLFLLYQLAIQCPKEHLPEVLSRPFTQEIVGLLEKNQDDEDFVEKALYVLLQLHAPTSEDAIAVVKQHKLNEADKAALAKVVALYPSLHARYAAQGNLTADEWQRIAHILS